MSTVRASAQSAARAAASAPSFAVTEPAAGEAVSGAFAFTASAAGIPSLASVEFALGSKRLGVATAAPFSVTWNTGYASDGSYALQATGMDAAGNVVATAQQIFTIQNHSNSLTVMAPDLSGTLSGAVTLEMAESDSQYFPALSMVNIDGEDAGDWWTDNLGQNAPTVNAILDTTRYPNGTHELYIGMHSNFFSQQAPQNKSWYNWRAGFERVINIDNGHTLMDVAANYLHAYMQPGQQLALSCTQLFTDNTSGPCAAPAWSSSDTSEVGVSSEGILTAGSNEGFATITLSDSGRSTNVYVWVKNSANVPHFAGNGQMLNAYQPGASLFVVAPFVLDPGYLEADPNLNAQVKLAGINTLSRGFYFNPYNVNFDYNTWQQGYDSVVAPEWQFAASNGFHILATGDDVARNIGNEAWYTLNWPSGQQAVQYAMTKMAQSGVAICVDMIDEVNSLWGATPNPPGFVGAPGSFSSISCSGSTCTVSWPNNPVNPSRFPSGTSFALAGSINPNLNTPAGQLFTASNITSNSFDFTPAGPLTGVFDASSDPGLQFLWFAGNIGGCPSQPCNPPVPNNALVTIRNWIETAPAHVPISWPSVGVAPDWIHANYMGPNGISDYASQYWDSFKVRHTYTWSAGIQESAYWMAHAFYDRQPLMMIDRPQLLLDSISGPAYYKNTPGGAYYTPPADTLDQPGVTAPVVTSTIMTAAALGAAGVRLYQFDTPTAAYSRANAPVGTYWQTGASPEGSDPTVTSNWQAISYAANSVTTTLAPYLLATALNSPAYGRNIVTAARQGSTGRMLLIVNDNGWNRTISVDFRPYRYEGGPITRYRITSDGITTATLPASPGETITLAGGESAAYVFSPGYAFVPVRRVRIARPRSHGRRAILHYSYVYQNPAVELRGKDCTRGCIVALDPNFGDAYYQFTYLGRRGRVSGRSAIQTIHPVNQ